MRRMLMDIAIWILVGLVIVGALWAFGVGPFNRKTQPITRKVQANPGTPGTTTTVSPDGKTVTEIGKVYPWNDPNSPEAKTPLTGKTFKDGPKETDKNPLP